MQVVKALKEEEIDPDIVEYHGRYFPFWLFKQMV